MKKFTLEVSDRVLTQAEWHSVRSNTPIVYRVETTGACLVLPGAAYNMYISEPIVINNIFHQPNHVENSTAPNQGISESFVLKALAIAQNPELAIHLTR